MRMKKSKTKATCRIDEGADLDTACKALGLSSITIEAIHGITRELKDFTAGNVNDVRQLPRHTRDRHQALLELAALSRKLRNQLEALPHGEALHLNTSLSMLFYPQSEHAHGLIGCIAEAQRLACLFAHAADTERSKLPSDGAAGGRQSSLGARAGYIAAIGYQLKPYGLRVGRGGDFERLCNAVFVAAGVSAKAEGPIKHFNEHMGDDYRERGYCL